MKSEISVTKETLSVFQQTTDLFLDRYRTYVTKVGRFQYRRQTHFPGMLQFLYATNSRGELVEPDAEDAENFCLLGGLHHVVARQHFDLEIREQVLNLCHKLLKDAILERYPNIGRLEFVISSFNDFYANTALDLLYILRDCVRYLGDTGVDLEGEFPPQDDTSSIIL